MAASSQGDSDAPVARGRVVTPDLGPIETLLAHGARLRPHAPELAFVFGERAAALAEAAGSERLWVHAEGLAVFARMRLGHRACVVGRSVAALRAAEAGGHDDLAALLRTDLALCARSVGVPLVGLAAIRPVLDDHRTQAVHRGLALLQFVGCMASVGRRGVLDRALTEADDLFSEAPDLDDDTRSTLRAAVRVRGASHLRRNGDLAAAISEAQRGIDLLDDPGSGVVDPEWLRVRLVLELVGALLDLGATEEADVIARPLLHAPPRAASVSPLAWLRLAIATRVMLPTGSPEGAATLIRDALYYSARHGLQALTARLWLELAHVEEVLGRPGEALRCMREARVNEHQYGRLRRQATSLLTSEFGRGEQTLFDAHKLLGERTAPAHGSVSTHAAADRAVPTHETTNTHEAAPAHRATSGARAVPPPRRAAAGEGPAHHEADHRAPEGAPHQTGTPAAGGAANAHGRADNAHSESSSHEVPSARHHEPVRRDEHVPSEPGTASHRGAHRSTAQPAAEHQATERRESADKRSAPPADPNAWPSATQAAARADAEPAAQSASAPADDDDTANALSVLARFGVTVGSGGRRRANDHGQNAEEDSATEAGKKVAESARTADTAAPEHNPANQPGSKRTSTHGAAKHGAGKHETPRHDSDAGQRDTRSRFQERQGSGRTKWPVPEPPSPAEVTTTMERPPAGFIALPKLKVPGSLAPPGTDQLLGRTQSDEANAEGAGEARSTQGAASSREGDARPHAGADAPKPPRKRDRNKDLNSVLAVFSNWTDEDEDDAIDLAQKRVVNGDSSVRGRHRGPA